MMIKGFMGRTGFVVALALAAVLVLFQPSAEVQAAPDGLTIEYPDFKPGEAISIRSRKGKPVALNYQMSMRIASSEDAPFVKASADEVKRLFDRLITKHLMEDMVTAEQQSALAAKLVAAANDDLAAKERRGGKPVAPGKVYVSAIIFKTFSMTDEK
jgi:hypothetical protein